MCQLKTSKVTGRSTYSRPRVELEEQSDTIELLLDGLYSLVPRVDERPSSKSFTNRHALLLTTGDTANGSITDKSVAHMAETEDGRDDVSGHLVVLLTAVPVNSVLWRAGLGGKAESLANRHGREMDVIFRAVLHISSVVLLNLRRRERIIVAFALNGVVFMRLVGEGPEEGRATGSRASQDD